MNLGPLTEDSEKPGSHEYYFSIYLLKFSEVFVVTLYICIGVHMYIYWHVV